MHTSASTGERIDLMLTIAEHMNLAGVVASALTGSSDEDIVMALRTTPALAHEFLQSVCVLEARAALAGTPWLDARGCADIIKTAGALVPSLDIRFDATGSAWQLTIDQFSFIGRCLAARPGLMRWAA